MRARTPGRTPSQTRYGYKQDTAWILNPLSHIKDSKMCIHLVLFLYPHVSKSCQTFNHMISKPSLIPTAGHNFLLNTQISSSINILWEVNFLREDKGTIIYFLPSMPDTHKALTLLMFTRSFLFPFNCWRNQRSALGLYGSTSLSQYPTKLPMLLSWLKNFNLLWAYFDLYCGTTTWSYPCLQDHHLV